jgi:hypothetical protein
MRYFGIKCPDGRIWWIGEDEYRAWDSFLTYPNRNGCQSPHRLPLEEAIRAYRAIGYRCVEVEVHEKCVRGDTGDE